MSWKSNFLVVAGALAALLAIDAGLSALYEPVRLKEVADAIVELEEQTPDVLVVSSSHGRSFHVIGEHLDKATSGQVKLISIPLEAGRIKAMKWVLENRARPLVEDARGNPKPPLSHLIFGVTWWDTCRREPPPEFDDNVISRAWRLQDYVGDVVRTGITPANRNFLTYRWRVGMQDTLALVGTREEIYAIYGGVHRWIKSALSGQPRTRTAAEEEDFMTRWRTDIETGHECFLAPSEQRALDEFVAYAKRKNLDLTIVLFPLMPATITEAGYRNTIAPFAERMAEYGRQRDVRVVNMTSVPVLGPDDYLSDYDHVDYEGNQKFAAYALEHDLKFLLDIAATPLARKQADDE